MSSLNRMLRERAIVSGSIDVSGGYTILKVQISATEHALGESKSRLKAKKRASIFWPVFPSKGRVTAPSV
jgi:hypothetical protein